MISWKAELNANEIAQVSSYVLGFEGTTSAAPKAPEGDVWINPDTVPVEEEDASKEEVETEVPTT